MITQYHKDTNKAILEWLNVIEQYDENYVRANIAHFKIRKIQQMTGRESLKIKHNNLDFFDKRNLDFSKGTLKIEESHNINNDISKLEKDTEGNILNDYKIMEINLVIQHHKESTNLADGLESLSERLGSFMEEDNNNYTSIDFYL